MENLFKKIRNFGKMSLVLAPLVSYPSNSYAFTPGQEVEDCGTIIESVEEVPGFFSYLIEPESLSQERYHIETSESSQVFSKGDLVCFGGAYLGRCYEDYIFRDNFFCGEGREDFYCGTMIFGESGGGNTIIPESLEDLLEGKRDNFFPKPSKEVIDIHPIYYLFKDENSNP